MKTLKLKVHRLIFWWYYRLVDDHFKQYPIITSIKLLRQHYEHEVRWHEGTKQVLKTAMQEADKYRKELSNMRMQQIANPGTIGSLNKMFGTDFNNPENN
jgi:hypothetical protein